MSTREGMIEAMVCQLDLARAYAESIGRHDLSLRMKLDLHIRPDAPRWGCLQKVLAHQIGTAFADPKTAPKTLAVYTSALGALSVLCDPAPPVTPRMDIDVIFWGFIGISRTILGSGTPTHSR